jgi:hypothetical protein
LTCRSRSSASLCSVTALHPRPRALASSVGPRVRAGRHCVRCDEDVIGESRFTDEIVPGFDRELTGIFRQETTPNIAYSRGWLGLVKASTLAARPFLTRPPDPSRRAILTTEPSLSLGVERSEWETISMPPQEAPCWPAMWLQHELRPTRACAVSTNANEINKGATQWRPDGARGSRGTDGRIPWL